MRKLLFVLVLALLTITLLAGCGTTTPTNHNPVISSANPVQGAVSVQTGEAKSFTITATDTDNDNLTYAWTASAGTPTTGNATTFSWTAPNQQGSVNISVVVNDGHNGTTTASWTVSVGAHAAPDVIEVSDNITAATTWQTGKVYQVTEAVSVENATLTIQPGTIIKFDDSTYLTAQNGGVIKAQGNATQPIIFTSILDDANGGDSNGNGPTQGAAGDWDMIDLNDVNGHIFDYCQFLYGGSSDYSVLELDSVSATVTNCTFAKNKGEDAALYAGHAASGTVIRNNTFYSNTKPMTINTTFNLDASNTFCSPADHSVINTHNGIYVIDGGNINSQVNWSETEIPFVLEDCYISSTGSLTIASGAVIKMLANSELHSEGTLNATNVTFTSMKDDTVGGDTDADTATTPHRADWKGIDLDGNSRATLSECKFLYADYAVYVGDAYVTIGNCTFAHNDGSRYGALYLVGATRNSSVTANTFYDNEKPVFIDINYNLGSSNLFSYQSQGNDYNAIFVEGTSIEYPVTWGETEVAYLCEGFVVNETKSLTLADNVVLKMYNDAEIDFYTNNFIRGTNCIITSYLDDTHKGDSNGDGSATSPYANYWAGVYDYDLGDYIVSEDFLWSEYSSRS